MKKIRNLWLLRAPLPIQKGIFMKQMSFLPPLNMGILAASLRNAGYYVEQDDLYIRTVHEHFTRGNNISKHLNDKKKLVQYLKIGSKSVEKGIENILNTANLKKKPDIILISAPVNTSDFVTPVMLALSKFLKRRFKVITVFGGSSLINQACEWGLKRNLFDFHIDGAGEKSIIKLIATIQGKGTLQGVPGLYYLKNSKLLHNKTDFPDPSIFPDFNGLPLNLYRRKIGKKNILILPYKFTAGCPNTCAFCYQSTFKGRFRLLDYKTAVSNIEKLSEKYNTRYFVFWNNHFNIIPEYSKKFCRELINRNLNICWSDCANEKGLDKELLHLMKESGCVRLVFGFESGSARILKNVNKHIDFKNLSKVLRWSHKIGIWNGIETIIGMPQERKPDLKETAKFLNENGESLDKIYLIKFRAHKQSFLGKLPEENNIKNFRVRQGEQLLRFGDYYKKWGGRFDEKNGFTWNEKKRYIDYSFNYVLNKLKGQRTSHKYNGFDEDLHLLYYAYSMSDNKAQVRKKFFSMVKKAYYIQALNPYFMMFLMKKRLNLVDTAQ